jgi:cell fate regulator YaaT (PSP1 superfamily)
MNKKGNNHPVIVGIRFSKIGKSYYFDASRVANLDIGDHLVVQTSRGWQIGEISEIVSNTKALKNTNYKPVNRIATEEDLEKRSEVIKRNEEVLRICIGLLHDSNLNGVKIISTDFSFDEKILSILYTISSEDSPNLEGLRSKIHENIPDTRIDFHKIGPRDAAKYYGGIGACGLECRCCTKFIGQFQSISIRMAKKQGISLNPSDITGMCDRLRCCLSYEFCHYDELLKNMPRRNKMVTTPLGRGKVRDLAPLKNNIYVYIEDYGIKVFDASEVEEIRDENPQRKNQGRNPGKNRRKGKNSGK